jgi:ribosomal protein L40E
MKGNKTIKEFSVNKLWCKYCNTVNESNAQTCMQCGKSELILCPAHEFEKLWQALDGYM